MLRIALVCAAVALFSSSTDVIATVKQQAAGYGPSASDLGMHPVVQGIHQACATVLNTADECTYIKALFLKQCNI